MLNLLYANFKGKIFDEPGYLMLGASGFNYVLPNQKEIIKLPRYSKFFFILDSPALGINKKTKKAELLDTYHYTVSVFLPAGYLRTLLPSLAFKRSGKLLPLWAYAACGFKNNIVYACAIKLDSYEKWNPQKYDDKELLIRAKILDKKFKVNSLYRQLFTCATIYHCFTAKNFFMGFSELAVPLSSKCNASCIGCISLQTDNNFPSSQNRITKTPLLKDVLELTSYHISKVKEPIVSFGQGCEGEPLLEVDTIKKILQSLKTLHKNTTFNINTNGSLTKNLKPLIRAGLDTARISINSAIKERYALYFRPKGYDFDNVVSSIKVLKDSCVCVMLNLLVFPGITDQEREIEPLIKLIQKTKPAMLQLRNLNIDPRLYLAIIKPKEKSLGIVDFLKIIRKVFPSLKIGSFNRPKSYFK
ncbi:MAG: radical SAM protein [Candidatus Omnitrophota bacterium]